MLVEMLAEHRKGTMLIIHITSNMKITGVRPDRS